MAVLAAAQLLDELMGRNRNVAPNEKVKELNWEDPEYCKYFMVKFCPHDLFVNTRADLGHCPKVHDEEIKKLFMNAKPTHHRKVQYQEDFLRFCVSMMNDVERKIVKGKQRLALSGKANEIPASSPAQTEKNEEQINLLNERINGLEAEAEQAGTEGNVEQAQGLMKLCDQLKEERENLKKQVENGHWNATAEMAAAQEKQMEVCQVCGAFLIVGDAQQRIEDHLMGKQHMGFARLRASIDEVTSLVKTAKKDRDAVRGGLGANFERDRERDREREKRREKDRDKEKEKREKDKDRNGDRDKEKERERDREKREKDKDRRTVDRGDRYEKDVERDRESRKDRDRGRDRDKNRERERSLDRERKRRSIERSRNPGRHHHRHHRRR
ncbi:unnamed protein product [Acanthoscelides obtectus]|uniref:Luc7-like protein 3 n=1 Tax=Acanthoscelides obtectus TaxID=200917 RepID=A0A9P0JN07_ACAOB|nr:unnamed protein product [Acanthoscelides obtectus]CAK1639818.1 Luc7-like protein 3 [Acanthoscelides obtectus]